MPSILIFFMGKTIALMNGISMNENLFTKSAFKIALECPSKLYYYHNPDVYANADVEDEFLQALADGGSRWMDSPKSIAECLLPLNDLRTSSQTV